MSTIIDTQAATAAERRRVVMREVHAIAELEPNEQGPRDRAAVIVSRRWLDVLGRAGLLDKILQKELF